ncbi:MAG: hypothetical protein SFV53_03525 [Rickettsiales bacterium]|nr:hypothetical protein [Rickettsiales bacterium]
MNKKFLQSVAAGIATLSLVASCSHFGGKSEANFCGAKNGCAAKKDEAHKCSGKKDEAHKCSAMKDEANKCASKTKSKKHKKSAVKKEETKTEETKN